MTEREILVEILEDAEDCLDFGTMADHLLQNGVIVPKLKFGQAVYHITNIDNHLQIAKGIILDVEKIYDGRIFYTMGYYDIHRYKFDWNEVGKSIFLTYEEAEKALKGV